MESYDTCPHLITSFFSFFFIFFFFFILENMNYFLLFILFTSLIQASKHKVKVVILGAGASGISFAKTLSQSNMHDYIVLDAQSFVGGKFGSNPSVLFIFFFFRQSTTC